MSNKNTDYVVMMHCKLCGHTQPSHLGACEQCGTDMGLYGAPIKVKVDEPTNKCNDVKEKDICPEGHQHGEEEKGGKGQKSTIIQETNDGGNDIKRPFPKRLAIVLGFVCAVLALIRVFLGGKETELIPMQNPQIPDFYAFADGWVEEYQLENFETYYSCAYKADQDVREVFDEYRDLLTGQYPYEEITTSNVSGEWEIDYYWYRYTGSGTVTNQTITVDKEQGQIEGFNVWMVYQEHSDYETAYIYIGASNEIADVDNGDRTSHTGELQITELSLDCYDLLYDPHDFTQTPWIPVGYDIGYDLSTRFTGQKMPGVEAVVTSSDESILQVDAQNARILAISPGTATITASLGDKTSSRLISVYPVDTSIGSTLEVSPSVIEISGDSQVQVSVTATMTFASDANVMRNQFLVAQGFVSHDGSGEWIKVGHRTYSKEIIFTIDPQKLDGKTDNGILFYMMHKGDDDDYDVERDILDYEVVKIIKK